MSCKGKNEEAKKGRMGSGEEEEEEWHMWLA